VPAILLAMLLAVVVIHPAMADPLPSAGALKEAEARAAELETLVHSAESELASIKTDLVALETELEAVQEQLDAATSVFMAADQRAMEAADRFEHARAALQDAKTELSDNQQTLGELARDTYKYGLPASSPVAAVLGSVGESENDDLTDRLHYLQRGIGVRAVALERSEALNVEVEHLTMRADAEAEEAEEAREQAEAARDEAARLHARVADLTSEASDKLERSMQLMAALETEQDEVATRIATLEARVAEEKAERERKEREERERKEREREAREREEQERREREAAWQRTAPSSASKSSSSWSKPSSGSGSQPGGTSIRPGPNADLVTVGGITVAASLGPRLQALLDQARADGIVLGGHGYRSPEVTARLRMANGCPDVYESPASACRVPTARPGTSEHEKGLAVDFTWQGQTICFPRPGSQCTGNAAYNWLRSNAHRYGLRNLPSEAWHWSTTGR